MSTGKYLPGYSSQVVSFMRRRTAATHAAFFLPYLKPVMRLLDVGCGPGSITLDLSRLVAPGEAVGVDLEPKQFSEVQEQARTEKLNVRFEEGSAYALPFPDSSFDAAFSHALVSHLAEPVRALKEIRRVLKPGGLVGLRAGDWGGVLMYPLTDEVRAGLARFAEMQRRNGGAPFLRCIS